MDKRQKRIIIIYLITILVLIAIGLSIAWLVSFTIDWKPSNWKDLIQWLFTNSGGIILGLVMKIIVNAFQIKKIEKTHESYGLNKKLEKKPEKVKKLDNVDKIKIILDSSMNNQNKIQEIKKIIGEIKNV